MKISTKQSFFAGSLAFFMATSCCWLPAFITLIGGSATLFNIINGLEKMSGSFMLIGVSLMGLGLYQWNKNKKTNMSKVTILESTLTCPHCKHQKKEIMPTDACQFFYECKNCKTTLKPETGDCCVYCSYGTVACPPIQLDQNCC